MNTLTLIAACGLGLGGAYVAASHPEQAWAVVSPMSAETVEGKIKSIDNDANKFVLAVESRDMEFKLNGQTTYSLDGKSASRDEAMKVGRPATVTHSDRAASRIDVKSK